MADKAEIEPERLPEPLIGRCLCGAVTITVTAMQAEVDICHCAMCQRWGGAFYAGVKGAEFLSTLGLETNPRNQIMVTDTLQTTVDPNIYALGDCASYTPPGEDRPIPPRAQAAHQMAAVVFDNICRMQKCLPLKHFVYRDNGSLVSLSRFSTVGSLMGNLIGGSMAIEGRLARFIYTSLYRMHLIGIHGWVKATFLMLIGQVNRIVRPKLKLH